MLNAIFFNKFNDFSLFYLKFKTLFIEINKSGKLLTIRSATFITIYSLKKIDAKEYILKKV